jgi:hypothetical protein
MSSFTRKGILTPLQSRALFRSYFMWGLSILHAVDSIRCSQAQPISTRLLSTSHSISAMTRPLLLENSLKQPT